MHEADFEMQLSRVEMSNSGEEVRHGGTLVGEGDKCRITAPSPGVSHADKESNKPFTIHHLESFIVIAK
jgi:hypothetical protein